MKKICFFAWFFWIMTALLSAQTLLIDPSSGGGFESGPSFQQSGWTVSKARQKKNSYRLGDKPGLDDGQGTRCAFISKNNSNWQSSTDASISHLYRTVSFPENASEILLDFLYKLKFTDIGYDGFKVYLSSSTPRAGRLPSGTQIGAECYDSATVWTNASISIPSGFAGLTRYLIFTWENDGSSPHAVGALDNISLSYTPGAILPIAQISPNPLIFEDFFPNYDRYESLFISNIGTGALIIDESGIDFSGDEEFSLYSGTTFPITIPAGESRELYLKFRSSEPGSFSATLTITDHTGTHNSIAIIALCVDNTIINYPYIEGFETEALGWVKLDEDQDGYNWELLHGTAELDFAYSGNGCLISRSWVPDYRECCPSSREASSGMSAAASKLPGSSVLSPETDVPQAGKLQRTDLKGEPYPRGPLSPDNWLFSPRMQLSQNVLLSWRVAAQDPAYPAEKYSVLISTTTPDINEFLPLFSETLSPGDWQYRELDLAAYTGQTVYLAFRHHDTYDQFFLKLDTIKFKYANTDILYGIVENGTVSLTMDPIQDTTQNQPLNVSLNASGITGTDILVLQIGYNEDTIEFPDAGLHLGLSSTGITGNLTMEVIHGLGFCPNYAYWRINPGTWSTIHPSSPEVSVWNETRVVLTIPYDAKGEGDLDMLFPQTPDGTLPVTFSYFTAYLTAGATVRINWGTASESAVLGYQVLRGTMAELANADLISELIPATNSSTDQVYEYIDREILPNSTYYYWLLSRDMDGSNSFYGPKMVQTHSEDGGTSNHYPESTAVLGNHPNPFNPSTRLRYALDEACTVKIKIYNQRGQLVRRLEQQHNAPGYFNIFFDGRSEDGEALSSGIYFYTFEAGRTRSFHKMTLLK